MLIIIIRSFTLFIDFTGNGRPLSIVFEDDQGEWMVVCRWMGTTRCIILLLYARPSICSLLYKTSNLYYMDAIVMNDCDSSTAEQTTAASSEDEDDSFITYMLIYFFSTLGSLLVLAIIILSIAIIILRMRNRSSNYTPLLSEEEKIAVMKQTGYVNPTYKFFDHAKDV